MVGQILILGLWLLVIPTLVGGLVAGAADKKTGNLPFLWISGQIILWAVFQLICVPAVLMEKNLSHVVTLYQVITALLVILALIMILNTRKRPQKNFKVISGEASEHKKWYNTMWAIFWVVLAFQLIQTVRMTYGDGDDAYYVAVSSITENSDTLYDKLPYTGGSTSVDVRHGLAPFPVWIAFLARVSGMRAVSVAHVAVPLILIPMTYGIYYVIGRRLCAGHEERIPVFLVFTQLLVLFGDYSYLTAENFMIARSRQGKAALGSIIFPMLLFLLFLIIERLNNRKKVGGRLMILLASVIAAGCLCSTLGAFLCCLLVGVSGICAAVCYRKWKFLVPMASCCIPAVCYVLLYYIM